MEATEFTIAHIGTYVDLEVDSLRPLDAASECRGSFGRLLAYIRTSGGDDLGAMLLSNGLAAIYRFDPFDREAQYKDLERTAREAQIGIWSP